ncbi:MAG: DUF1566 domain-containing protein [Thermodesulfobacteriota bacterium]|nr:DUF1566 domain-containing protein [Thermodesulfobacteriota bacterium]
MQETKKRFLWTILLIGCCLIIPNIQIEPARAQEERFEVMQNGTVKDQKTGLIWAAQDNGANLTWGEALAYCKNYSAGGHKDWRMPTPEELATLYGASKEIKSEEDKFSVDLVTKSIQVTAPWVWTSRRSPNNKAVIYGFNFGTTRKFYRGRGMNRRALPVRSAVNEK